MCCPGLGSASKGPDSGPSLSFSGGIPGSFSQSQLDTLSDPAVERLEAVLSVRDSGPSYPVPACPRDNAAMGMMVSSSWIELRVCLLFRGHPPARCPPGYVSVAVPGEHTPGSNAVTVAVLGEYSRRSDGAAAGSSPRTIGFLEGIESDDSKKLANVGMITDLVEGMEGVRSALGVRRDCGGARTARETAGESEGIIGSSRLSESDFPSLDSSRLGSLSSACARRVALVLLLLLLHVFALVLHLLLCLLLLHMRSTRTHVAHISWSDTIRVQGPTGTRRVKGGVSSPAEDLRPVSEVETGVNFRPAGGVRGQVAGSLPGREPRTGTRRHREGAVTPSLHPEVPVPDSRHLDVDWASGNQRAGRRCVEPYGRGFGC